MSYPSLEQYNEALQSPQLSLIDPELKTSKVETTQLGLPLALCGGFALTYTLTASGKKYAVRCFHKESSSLELRYKAISSRLRSLRSPYFLAFEFQSPGIRVNSKPLPVVKMAWAKGMTLGEFLEDRHRRPSELKQLGASLRGLATYLESNRIAHGDIQPGNVMVAGDGREVQLIDYDGMFLDEITPLGSAELGHRNFQHPARNASTWSPALDRFSFIALVVALQCLEAYPDLWSRTQSDGDSILFKANDFADPTRSALFSDLAGRSQVTAQVKNLASLCRVPVEKVPTLDDFLSGRNIPQGQISISTSQTPVPARYISAHEVLDPNNYSACLRRVGDRVELVGRIAEVSEQLTNKGKPYVFINFGPWRGEIVKLTIWPPALKTFRDRPNRGWAGKWVSVVGLLEPPYRSNKFGYSHIAITIKQASQLHVITESEARYRLSGSSPATTTRPPTSSSPPSSSRNAELLDEIRGTGPRVSRSSTPPPPSITPNQAILQGMKATQSTSTSANQAGPSRTPPASQPSPSGTGSSPAPQENSSGGCIFLILFFIFLIIVASPGGRR